MSGDFKHIVLVLTIQRRVDSILGLLGCPPCSFRAGSKSRNLWIFVVPWVPWGWLGPLPSTSSTVVAVVHIPRELQPFLAMERRARTASAQASSSPLDDAESVRRMIAAAEIDTDSDQDSGLLGPMMLDCVGAARGGLLANVGSPTEARNRVVVSE